MNLDIYLSTNLPHLGILKFIFRKKPPEVIFEIGACEGEDSERYSILFPESQFYLFEPALNNAEIIRARIASGRIPNAQLFEVAVGDHNGEADLHESSGHPEGFPSTTEWNYGNKSSSLLRPLPLMAEIYNWLKFERSYKVQVVTLESIARQTGVFCVDFIHMDVQGAEMMVLKGAGDFLRKVCCIWVEVAKRPIYEQQVLDEQLQGFLEARGFIKVFENMSGATGDHFYVNSERLSVEQHLLERHE